MTQPLSRRTILAAGAGLMGGLFLDNAVRAQAPKPQGPKRRVVVWSEGSAPKNVYPHDINAAVAEGLKASLRSNWEVVTASLNDPDQGFSGDSLAKTDVLIWWGHVRHGDVKDTLVDQIVHRVKDEGMGFIGLHSSHFSKALKKLLGTNCGFAAYVADGSGLDVTVKAKDHPIARGISDFSLEHTERYTEPFEIPEPEAVVFDGVYKRPDGSKESSRQGLVWTVGKGKVFYFQPGHETYPHFFDKNVRKVLRNAVRWAAPKK
jgi:trehalose utilization protein